MIANPPPWPHGARCAAAITFDIDADSGINHPSRSEAARRMSYLSWSRYDEVAVPRILRIYQRFGIRQTFFMPGACIEQHPSMVEAILDHGHEIAIHGHVHEDPDSLNHDEERRWFERSLRAYASRVGGVPLGYRAPNYHFSDHTADLLTEHGLLYDSSLMGDDVPYLLQTRSGSVVELPVEWVNEDWVQFGMAPDIEWIMQIRSPDEGMAVFRAELEAAHEYGGLWIAVWHPMVSGRLSRARGVEQLIEMIQSWGDVWLAPLGEIATYMREKIDDGSYSPRVDQLPYRF